MITVLEKTDQIELALGDCELTRNSLTIRTALGFDQAGRALAAMDSYSQFWWGDYLLYAEKNNLRTVLDNAHSDLHRSTIYSYIEVCRFYAVKDRRPALSFTHHSAAMYILGVDADPAKAQKWLARAEEKNWTVGELREAMRTDNRRAENDPGPDRAIVRITDFVKISKWTAKIHAGDLPSSQIDEIRASTGPLLEFLLEVHRKPFVIT